MREVKQASAQHQAASLALDLRVILCYLIVAFVVTDIQQVFDIVLHGNAPWLSSPVALLAASGHVTSQKLKDSLPKIYSSDPRLMADHDNFV